MARKKLMFHKAFIIFIFSILFISNLHAETDIDQWQDSDKTYKDLIEEGFEVKAYDTSTLKTESGLILMFFVTVLQKENEVYECQEYQTLDLNMQTLDMTVICRQLVQPYKKGLGT